MSQNLAEFCSETFGMWINMKYVLAVCGPKFMKFREAVGEPSSNVVPQLSVACFFPRIFALSLEAVKTTKIIQ